MKNENDPLAFILISMVAALSLVLWSQKLKENETLKEEPGMEYCTIADEEDE